MINEIDLNFDATANAILSELDKGLRSCRLGDESEAIVKFDALFCKHPFPILINSACLKLAELFRNCSNFSRLLILRVLQQSEKHLEKILNLDEFIRRITTVCYSNDPVARAITLRVLGSIACVASQRKHIHHAIRNSLDSTDEIEVQASIEAAALFAKKSPLFALSIYPKILSILSSECNLSVDTKIKLLSVLHHEHYNSEISKDVRQRCLNYLKNETDYFISSVLHTLTYISITSLTDIQDQIEILLNYFKNKSNMRLKYEIIKELQLLTKTSPHFWTKQNIADLISILNNKKLLANKSSNLICGLLIILEELIRCPCLLADMTMKENKNYLQVFYAEAKNFCLSIINEKDGNTLDKNRLNKTANCLRVMTELSIKSTSTSEETIDHLINFLSSTAFKLNDLQFNDYARSFKLILKCVVKIANQSDSASNKLIDLLCSILNNKHTSNRMISLVCETICAIENKNKNNPNLIKCIRQLFVNDHKLDDQSLISLCTVYFQLASLSLEKIKNLNMEQLNLDNNRSAWFLFKLVRQTMRYGHHEISLKFCDKFQYYASNENIYFWFMGLLKISEAECCLIRMTKTNKEDSLLNSIKLLSESLSFLKASILNNYPQSFACEFIKLRSKYLHNNFMLIKFCKMIRSSPAASISNLIALNSRDEILKCGSIVNQMRENCKEFRKLTEDYGVLYQNSFNADQNTLIYLQLLQNCSTIMAEAIESIFHANRVNQTQAENDFDIENLILPEHYLLKKTCNEVRHHIRTKLYNQSDSKLSTQTDHLLEISDILLKIPIVIPRYFFQPLQNTVLKLAISPQPNSTEQSIVIYSNTNFALKVEGLIKNTYESTRKRKVIREVKQILIQVTSITKSNILFYDLNKSNEAQKLQSIVEPHNDYFQEQFLLNLKIGYHQLNIKAIVIDQDYCVWNLIGANSSLNVKVLEQS